MNRWREDRRGQAMVEMAIVLPLLLLVLMGIIDFGRIYHGYLTVTTAAREAARQAALGANDDEIRQTALAAAAPLPVAALTVDVNPAAANRYPGTAITVEVRCRLPILTPIMQGLLESPFTVLGQAVMKKE
ncbi:MAG: TadE/TadG family type IV pilus assembly protein [Bacillota bacterium]|jgi:Flp pilus assembly protein TadG